MLVSDLAKMYDIEQVTQGVVEKEIKGIYWRFAQRCRVEN